MAGNIKNSVGAEIRRRRKALGMTLEELAFKTVSNDGNLSKLERGIIGYTDEGLHKIAAALGCTAADLFLGCARGKIVPVPIGSRRIPRITYERARHCLTDAPFAPGDKEDWILTDLKLSQHAFALPVRGDSMLPEFREGDTVLIDPAVKPRPGDFVVAACGLEVQFMKYRLRGMSAQGDETIELVPLNDDFPPIRSDTTPIQVIGTMVEHRRYRRR